MRRLFLDDEILLTLEKPSRYTGGEHNSYDKDFDSVKNHIVFCFPDVYEIGVSHLGMQIIYEQFNRLPDTMCDRVYSPWFDLDRILREKNLPLFAVESQRPVSDFDFLLITLQYEMCYTNVLQILDLSHIPLLAKDRNEEDPIVIGGGPCSYNPEPIAAFFDGFYIGESEVNHEAMLRIYREGKENGKNRHEILKELSKEPGFYIPEFYETEYASDGTIKSFRPTDPSVPSKIRRQVVTDFSDETLPYPLRPLVPFTRGMMDRATIEVMRGCIRGCRFCQAGMIYRPVRNRNAETLKKWAVRMIESGGFDEINLSSLSTSDYSEFRELLSFLLPYCEKKKVNIGIPSLRIDAFSLELMSKIQDIRKTSLTFAPEAGSQRMRDTINKGLTEEDILSGAEKAFAGGWNKVKLYFMLGLPGENESDIKAIPALSEKIAETYYAAVPKEQRIGKCSIQISTSFFVPKPFTPFQWAPQDSEDAFLEKAYLVKDTVRELLNKKSIQYHYHEEHQAVLEGLFARGDRRVSEVILRAYRKGCIFDAWSEYLKIDLWREAMEESGVSFSFYNFRERSVDEILPWDFIDIGVRKDFLRSEWEKSKRYETTENCRKKCSNCGASCYQGGVCFESKN